MLAAARADPMGGEGDQFLSRWREALQLLQPVEHDMDLGRSRPRLTPLDHHEPLAVGSDVVVGVERCVGSNGFEQQMWRFS